MRAPIQKHGQATLELALGSIVFVGVLLIGIHMAEYAQLSLKVQDAATYAIWDASGRRVQTRAAGGGTDTAPFDRTLDTVTGVGPNAQRRFKDFDGLSTSNNGAVISRALTQGSGVDVTCKAEDSLVFRASATPARAGLFLTTGGLNCTAEAKVKAINIPKRFLQNDNGGFFEHKIVRSQPIPICGMGLPVNGNCRGSLAILTNDWGLANDETDECKLSCSSSPYRGLVSKMWGGGGGAGAAFASRFAGSAPASAGEFYFSYSGVESGMTDFVGGEGTPSFITGGAGAGMVPRMTRPKCFLGKDCP